MSDFAGKREIWAEESYDQLVKLSAGYHSNITYGALKSEVEAATGISTDMLVNNWSNKVLDDVADLCKQRAVPLLTALVVNKDSEEVSGGYADAVRDVYGEVPDDVEMHAAIEREKCYRAFGAVIPPNAAPALTPKVVAARRRKKVIPKRPVCPTCHLELPRSGICDTCA